MYRSTAPNESVGLVVLQQIQESLGKKRGNVLLAMRWYRVAKKILWKKRIGPELELPKEIIDEIMLGFLRKC